MQSNRAPPGSSVYTGRNSFTPAHSNRQTPSFGAPVSNPHSLQLNGSSASGNGTGSFKASRNSSSSFSGGSGGGGSGSGSAVPPPPPPQWSTPKHTAGSYARPSPLGGGSLSATAPPPYRSLGAAAAPPPAMNTPSATQPYHLSLQVGGMRPDTQPQPFRRYVIPSASASASPSLLLSSPLHFLSCSLCLWDVTKTQRIPPPEQWRSDRSTRPASSADQSKRRRRSVRFNPFVTAGSCFAVTELRTASIEWC